MSFADFWRRAKAVGRFSTLVTILSISAFSTLDARTHWDPIKPADLASKKSEIDPKADAEILFWRNEVIDSSADLSTSWMVYKCIKIYTKAGASKQAQITIPFAAEGEWLRDLAARTISPDGKIVELDRHAIVEQEVQRPHAGESGEKEKVFALPGVVPGSIIEYRYRQIVEGDNFMKLKDFVMQADIPARTITYKFTPLRSVWASRNVDVQLRLAEFVPLKGMKRSHVHGTYTFTINNVPAVDTEPYMPPKPEVESWIRAYYATEKSKDPKIYWRQVGRQAYDEERKLDPSRRVRRAAKKIVGKASSDTEKAKRLYDFCRSDIRHVLADGEGAAGVDVKKLDDARPEEILRLKAAYASDIDDFYITLCRGVGLDARELFLTDRSQHFTRSADAADMSSFQTTSVAVKVGDNWVFCDPESLYLPFGRLRWQETGFQGLIPDPDKTIFVQIPLLSPTKSIKRRRMELTLSKDGSVSGKVRLEYSGIPADQERIQLNGLSATDAAIHVNEAVTGRFPSAKVTDVEYRNINNPYEPLICTFKITVPDYAETTGSRLFVQPAFWEKGEDAVFPSSKREYGLYFPYQWLEDDRVEMRIPQGYSLESPDEPPAINAGIFRFRLVLGYNKPNRMLECQRLFLQDGLIVSKGKYTNVKRFFDLVARDDKHVLILKGGGREKTASGMDGSK